jgi:hypothetical protein
MVRKSSWNQFEEFSMVSVVSHRRCDYFTAVIYLLIGYRKALRRFMDMTQQTQFTQKIN